MPSPCGKLPHPLRGRSPRGSVTTRLCPPQAAIHYRVAASLPLGEGAFCPDPRKFVTRQAILTRAPRLPPRGGSARRRWGSLPSWAFLPFIQFDKPQFTNPHCHFPQKTPLPATIVTQAFTNVKEIAEKIQKPLDNCGKMWYIIREKCRGGNQYGTDPRAGSGSAAEV